MIEPRILRYATLPTVDRGGGTRTTPLVTGEIGIPRLRTGTTRFVPGASVPLHTHNCDEVIVLIEGEGVAVVAEAEHPVRPYDTVVVPAGVAHCFRNTGPGPMAILWTYPADRVTRTFVATGETVEHLSDRDRITQPR